MAECVLRVRHLRKAYRGREVLSDVSFQLEAGSAAALTGPKGAGKTTLLRILAGQVFPEEGTVSLFGSRDEGELRLARRQSGFLLDSPSGYPLRSLEKNLILGAALYGKPDPAYIRQLRHELGLVRAEQIDRRMPFLRLPQGQRELCALAAVLVHKPRLLILDEPLLGLSGKSAERLAVVLGRLREEGAALLLTGEDPEDLRPLCTRTLRLEAGEVTEEGPEAK